MRLWSVILYFILFFRYSSPVALMTDLDAAVIALIFSEEAVLVACRG
jgi:hypothetical protein